MGKYTLFAILLGMVVLGTTASRLRADDSEIVCMLEKFFSFKLPTPDEMARARKIFPLEHEKTRVSLAKAVQKPMMPEPLGGLARLLYSHGPRGFLWGISRLAETDDLWTRANILWALRFHDYRETYVLYSSLLSDETVVPIPIEFLMRSELSRRPNGYGPDRVCTMAGDAFRLKMKWRGDLPAELDAGDIWKSVLEKDRRKSVELLKAWWAKEGERYITATRPSVVEVLLKEAEEKGKKEAEGGDTGKGTDAGTGGRGDAGKKQMEEKAREPARPEGEKKEPAPTKDAK